MNIDTLRRAFGDRTFSSSEAAWALGLRRPSGTLSRLKAEGRIVSEGRSRYRLASPGAADELRSRLNREVVNAVLDGPVAVALDGPDAVAVWTGGRYRAPARPATDVVYLACAGRDADILHTELAVLGVEWARGSSRLKGTRLAAVVRVLNTLRRVRREGLWVVPRAEVLKIIRNDPAAYEGAEEWVVP